jgi:hypothetical protein
MKIKYIAINRTGRRVNFIENHDIDDTLSSVEILECLDDIDKSDLINKRDLLMIIDFFPYIKKTKNPRCEFYHLLCNGCE